MESIDFICKNLNPTLLFVNKKNCTVTGTAHKHDYIELTYVLEGVCEYEINGEHYSVKHGDLLFINPGDVHKTIITDEKELPVLFAIGFTDINLNGLNIPENTFRINNIPIVYSCPEKLCSYIEGLVEEIMLEKTNRLPGRYFYMHACLVQLILKITRHFYKTEDLSSSLMLSNVSEEELSSHDKKKIVENICTYINEHYAEKISLEGIAANMYLSPIYISKLFKEEMGDSPINYLISVRLKKAASLLKNSQLPISEISTLIGYENPYYFSKLFKRSYGVSPKDFRK